MTPNELNFLGFQSPGTKEKVTIEDPITVATVAGLMPAPKAFITRWSGALAVNLIALPYEGFAGTVMIIPTGAFTLATGGVATATDKPIGVAMAAATPGLPVFLTYSPLTGLWYAK
jgi:hypothetical protein